MVWGGEWLIIALINRFNWTISFWNYFYVWTSRRRVTDVLCVFTEDDVEQCAGGASVDARHHIYSDGTEQAAADQARQVPLAAHTTEV